MTRCSDPTENKRCNQPVISPIEGEAPRCYYHDKLYRGLLESSSALTIEDMDD